MLVILPFKMAFGIGFPMVYVPRPQWAPTSETSMSRHLCSETIFEDMLHVDVLMDRCIHIEFNI